MADKEYRYYKDNGNLMRLHIEQDDEPLDPRYDWDGQIGKMMCWHRDYRLGDYKDNDYNDNEDFLNNLIRENVEDKSIINYIKAKKASNGLELRYDRHEQMWQLWGTYYWFPLGTSREAKFDVIEEYESLDWLVDDMIEALPQKDKWYLLEKHANIVYLPLYLYDHSGITMSTGSFGDRWDSGQVGYIYTDKKTIIDCGDCGGKIRNEKGNYVKITDKNWKKAAYQCMQGEVEEYDMYLTGEVYGVITEEYNAEEKIGGKDLMNNFTIYRNYGVLRAEKRNVYTYGAPHINGVCSDELKVKLPDDCDWKLFENNFGQTMIETPWGWAYNLNEVLQGNESPCLYALDKDQKAHRVELVIIEEK